MKKIVFAILIALALSCNTTMPLRYSLDESTLVRIDCQNDQRLQYTIYQMLRAARARDITTEKLDGQSVVMKAVYMNRDVSYDRIETVTQDIRSMPGVITALVEENRSPVLQVNERAPVRSR